MKKYLLSLALVGCLYVGHSQAKTPTESVAFPTGGHTVYHLCTANIGSEQSAIVSASFDGTVMCHDRNGDLRWEQNINNCYPFDIDAADVDGDGTDEIFVARAGGGVDAYSSSGEHLWSYEAGASMHQVLPAKRGDGSWSIFTGGVTKELIELSADGKVISTTPVGDVLRNLLVAKSESAESESLIVCTLASGLWGQFSLHTFDLSYMKYIRHKRFTDVEPKYNQIAYDVIPIDLDQDGKDEFIAAGNGTELRAYDSNHDALWARTEGVRIPYRMMFIAEAQVDGKRSIIGQYGGFLNIYDTDGTIRETLRSYGDYTGMYYDQATTTLLIGSSSSGGDGIYSFNLSNPKWKQDFTSNKYVGRMKEVNENLATLAKQIKAFKRPEYQKPQTDIYILGDTHKKQDYPNMKFVATSIFAEKLPDTAANREWDSWREQRAHYKYETPQEEILAFAKSLEDKKQYFSLWGCHGWGPSVFLSLETMCKIIDIAPKYFVGFVLPEMENIDDRMRKYMKEVVEPLAEYSQPRGKKLILWNKYIFWGGTCYEDFWPKLLFNPKYKGVFVPAMEESCSRTQEISLAGCVGLYTSGDIDWCSRIVSDNTAFNWMWLWGSQQNPSYYFRQIALDASYGAKSHYTDVNQASISDYLRDQLQPLHEMLSKGVVIVPEKEDILSLSPLCLGMSTPPSRNYIRHGSNGHGFRHNEESGEPMIFDHMDCYWGATELLDHDFSKYGYGCQRRQYNYLPRLPYGMVAIVPQNADLETIPHIEEMVKTDGEFFYDAKGKKRDAVEYKDKMIKKLEAAAAKMPIVVSGDASWSAVRVDDTHIRVLLVDPGYISPAERQATIKVQNAKAIKCTDILSGEDLKIKKNKINLTVPAGVIRVVDVEVAF